MKAILCYVLALVVVTECYRHYQENDALWAEWKQRYGKQYRTVEVEQTHRDIWEERLSYIQYHNNRVDVSFKLGLNDFSDQIRPMMPKIDVAVPLNGVNTMQKLSPMMEGLGALPSTWDWRDKGAITPVINQGQTSYVEAYGASECVESYGKIKGGPLTVLSAEEVSDCCLQGGLLNPAVFDCISSIGGLCSNTSYHSQGSCGNTTCSAAVQIKGGRTVPARNEKKMQRALLKNPLLVAVDASLSSFQMYTSGVYDDPSCSSSQLDHMLQIVGYGVTREGLEYWICKNTWGESWGMRGFIWIARNKNMCGISEIVLYPH